MPHDSLHEEIRASYRFMVGREPSEQEIRNLARLENVDAVRFEIAALPEFHRSQYARRGFEISARTRLSRPRLSVQLAGSEAETKELFQATEETWEELGREEPFYSVVTAEQFRMATFEEQRDNFNRSGEADVAECLATLDRNAPDFRPDSADLLEIGCGVGRMSIPFSREFNLVKAVDVSSPHLAEAERYAKAANAERIRFTKVSSIADFSHLGGYDIVYSYIVLQHNPPPVMRAVLDAAFANLRPAGLAVIHVPSYIEGYKFSISEYLKMESHGMEMHCLPQAEMFALMRGNAIVPLEVMEEPSFDYRFEFTRFVGRKHNGQGSRTAQVAGDPGIDDDWV